MYDFAKPNSVPEAIRKFLGLKDDVELPRNEIVKQIYNYVREKNLCDKDNHNIIHPDSVLKMLLNIKECETLDFEKIQDSLSYHYLKSGDKDNIKSKIETEEDLLAQIEELKKKAEELRNKAKEMEDQNKDTEFNKQRNFLIDTVRNFLNIQVSDEEICAVLYRFYPIEQGHIPITYYLKKEDENMLFERKVSNRYARYHDIRCEDSDMIFCNFIRKIKPLISPEEFNAEQHKKAQQHSIEQRIKQEQDRMKGIYKNGNYPQYVREKYIPLFC